MVIMLTLDGAGLLDFINQSGPCYRQMLIALLTIAAFYMLIKKLADAAIDNYEDARSYRWFESVGGTDGSMVYIRNQLARNPIDYAWEYAIRSGSITQEEYELRILMPPNDILHARRLRRKIKNKSTRSAFITTRRVLATDPAGLAWGTAWTCGAISECEYLSRKLDDEDYIAWRTLKTEDYDVWRESHRGGF